MTPLPEVHTRLLANGCKVLLRPTPHKDILCLSAVMPVGARDDPPEQAGRTNLLARLLTKGTRGRSAFEIAEVIESIGGEIGAFCTHDYAGVETQTVSEDWQTALELLTDCLFEPALPSDEVEKEIGLLKALIRRAEDDKFAYTYRRFEKMLYAGHPYAIPTHGEPETLDQLDRECVAAVHARTFRPETAHLVVVGNVPEEEFLAELERRWPERMDASVEFPPRGVVAPFDATEAAGRGISLSREVEQSVAVLGYPAPPVGSPEATALRLACGLLGEGMSSRLFTNLREKRHLAYAVGSSLGVRELASHLLLYIGTSPDTLEEALDGLRGEADRLARDGVPEDELERARQYLLGRYLVGRQTNAALARGMSTAEMWSLGWAWSDEFPARLRAVTVEDVNRAAARCLGREPATATLAPRERANA